MDYEDHLDRAMTEKPDIAGTESRFEIPEPVVRQEGNETVYENFDATVDRLDRDPRHVRKFLQDEFGTSARIDDAGRARFTGSFDESRIAEALEEYVDVYVRCPECGLPDTALTTERGAELLVCDACGARSSVGSS